MNDEAIIIACDEIVPEKIGKEKLNLYQLWHEDTYPDDYSLCKIAFCLARKCHELHLKGLMIANEWNEGNILISTTDCSVSITDVYAMNLSGISLRGTDGYLAPECYINHKYDLYSDYYGLAVFFYRMFIGGFPLDGKASEEYCTKRKRTTDREWMQTFKVVAKTGLKQCPVCHRRLFIGRTVCPWCK